MNIPGRVRADARVALVTGCSRRLGIGAAVAQRLASDGYDIALTSWPTYDARMPWGADPDSESIAALIEPTGVRMVVTEADLEQPEAAETLFRRAEEALGPVTVLVLCHCESVDSSILDTTLESFDRHLLIREFGLRDPRDRRDGRIVALTSDHTAGNLPYGASKAPWTGSLWPRPASSLS